MDHVHRYTIEGLEGRLVVLLIPSPLEPLALFSSVSLASESPTASFDLLDVLYKRYKGIDSSS